MLFKKIMIMMSMWCGYAFGMQAGGDMGVPFVQEAPMETLVQEAQNIWQAIVGAVTDAVNDANGNRQITLIYPGGFSGPESRVICTKADLQQLHQNLLATMLNQNALQNATGQNVLEAMCATVRPVYEHLHRVGQDPNAAYAVVRGDANAEHDYNTLQRDAHVAGLWATVIYGALLKFREQCMQRGLENTDYDNLIRDLCSSIQRNFARERQARQFLRDISANLDNILPDAFGPAAPAGAEFWLVPLIGFGLVAAYFVSTLFDSDI